MKACKTIVLIMLILTAVIGACSANDAYKNNPDYKMIYDTEYGNIDYLDIKSIEVLKYEPPIYEIRFKRVCYHTTDQSKNQVLTFKFRYNYETKQLWYMNKNGECHEFNVYKDYVHCMFADEVFKIAYGIPFYNKIENGRIALCGLSPLHGNFQQLMRQLEEMKQSQPLGLIRKGNNVFPGGTKWIYNDKRKTMVLFFRNDGSLMYIVVLAATGGVTPDGIGLGAKGKEIIGKYGPICSSDLDMINKDYYHYASADGCHILFEMMNGEVRYIQAWCQET